MNNRKRSRIIGVIAILALAVVIGIGLIHKNTTNKENEKLEKTKPLVEKSMISQIYLYHKNNVKTLMKDSSGYNELTEEAIHLLNRSDIYRDTIDGECMLKGNGEPMDETMHEHLIEISFTKPVTFTYRAEHQMNVEVARVLLSLDDECIYIFQPSSAKETRSFAGFSGKPRYFTKLLSMVKQEFNE